MCNKCLSLALGLDDRYYTKEHPIYRVIPDSSYVHKDKTSEHARRTLSTWIAVSMCDDDHNFVLGDKKYDIWITELNTAIAMGNNALKFLARMHAQCEIHGWVEGPNRKWLAAIMREGRKTGMYRPDEGWEDVVTLLETRDDEPVVMSYSVCDQFPNWRVAEDGQKYDHDDGDSWYKLQPKTQWKRALAGLRSTGIPLRLELKPDDWNDYNFGHGITGFHVMEYAVKIQKEVEFSEAAHKAKVDAGYFDRRVIA